MLAASPETQAKALDVMPSLKGMYFVGGGLFEIYYLDKAKTVCTNMSGESQELLFSQEAERKCVL